MSDSTTRLDFLGGFEMDDGYDPLADLVEDAADDAEERDRFAEIAPSNAGEPLAPGDADKVDDRPASERIEELFRRMAPQRRAMLAILNACFTPASNEQIDALVRDMQTDNRSVFGPGTICELLERAGALQHVVEDGTPLSEVQVEPETVVVDGVEYIQAAEPPADFWQSTQDGRDFAAKDDPAARLAAQLGEEEKFVPIYQKILRLCAGMEVEGAESCADGMTTKALSDIVDPEPVLRVAPTKRLFTMYFLERLDKCDALEFVGNRWKTARIGLQYLESLDAE